MPITFLLTSIELTANNSSKSEDLESRIYLYLNASPRGVVGYRTIHSGDSK